MKTKEQKFWLTLAADLKFHSINEKVDDPNVVIKPGMTLSSTDENTTRISARNLTRKWAKVRDDNCGNLGGKFECSTSQASPMVCQKLCKSAPVRYNSKKSCNCSGSSWIQSVFFFSFLFSLLPDLSSCLVSDSVIITILGVFQNSANSTPMSWG